MSGHSVLHLPGSLPNIPKMNQENSGINFLYSGPPPPPNTFNFHLQTSLQSSGDPCWQGLSDFFFRCPARLPGPPVEDQINWPLFETWVGLGGFLLPFSPLFLAATSLWDKRRPGDPREAAFLWVPGGSSAEPQGLRHTH